MRPFKALLCLSLLVTAFVVLPGLAPFAWAQRPKVAVMDFEFGAVHQWWTGEWDIGKGVCDLIVDELVNDGNLRRHRAQAARHRPGRAGVCAQ